MDNEVMRSDPHDSGERFFQAARWYLPPMAGEPEPDSTLACAYALLAVYTKLDRLIGAMSADGGEAPTTEDAARDLSAMLRTLGWQPPQQIGKGLGHN
jgi:hypothetical protein